MTASIHADGGAPPEIRTLDHAEFGGLAATLIASRGGVRFRAHGRSMRPTIRSGDILTVEKADPATVGIGDIVMIRTAAGAILVHRVIKRDAETWTTCGDALQSPDERVSADQLIGIVRTIENDGVKRRLSKPRGYLMAARSRFITPLIRRLTSRLFATQCAQE